MILIKKNCGWHFDCQNVTKQMGICCYHYCPIYFLSFGFPRMKCKGHDSISCRKRRLESRTTSLALRGQKFRGLLCISACHHQVTRRDHFFLILGPNDLIGTSAGLLVWTPPSIHLDISTRFRGMSWLIMVLYHLSVTAASVSPHSTRSSRMLGRYGCQLFSFVAVVMDCARCLFLFLMLERSPCRRQQDSLLWLSPWSFYLYCDSGNIICHYLEPCKNGN